MREPEDLEAGLAARLRRISDEPVAHFDAERTASVAMSPDRRQPFWRVLATAAAAVAVVGISVGIASNLGEPSPAGQTSVDPSNSLEVVPSLPLSFSPAPSAGLSEAEAIAAAREAAPDAAEHDVLFVRSGPASELLQPPEAYEFIERPADDQWVWVVTLGSGEPLGQTGSIVVLDFGDGTVLGVMNFIS